MRRAPARRRPAAAAVAILLSLVGAAFPAAQHYRGRERPKVQAPEATTVTSSQAVEVTLTLTAASMRTIQTWVRAAGRIDDSRRIVSAFVPGPDAALIAVGQRARAFPVQSRSSVNQARVTRVVAREGGVLAEATLSAQGRPEGLQYLVEIIVDRGVFLSVPSEAIIEEQGRRIVYVRKGSEYARRQVQIGLQGELYTEVVDGLSEGDEVVTFGSFFIDAEHKLKIAGPDEHP